MDQQLTRKDAMTETTAQETTYRQVLRQWIKQQVDGSSEVNLPDLTASAVEHFSSDKAFLKAFLTESLRPLVYEQARLVLQGTRGAVVVLGDEIVTKEILAERAQRLQSRWSRWMEHVGDRHVNLMAMTKDDLLTAALERRQRAETEIEIARLWEVLANKLKKNETVGQRFTAEEIERMRLSLRAHQSTEKAA